MRPTMLAIGLAIAIAPPPRAWAADALKAKQEAMVTSQIAERGVRDAAVLAAMRRVPRHRFVPEALRDLAYEDRPLPIGLDQTISQPYIVALMTELCRPRPGMKVLEIGTGSGYQAAVLAEIVSTVHTIEIIPELGRRATATLSELGYRNIAVHIGDGFEGWPASAPYDAIVVTAAPTAIPAPLLDQLVMGGRLVIPVGSMEQELLVVTKTDHGFVRKTVIPVRFVPMTGKAQGLDGPAR